MIIQGATISGSRIVDGSVLTKNLLIRLDANNSSSYSGTGTTVNDLSGNGYTHTMTSAGIYTVLNGVKCFDCSTTGEVYAAVTGPILPTTGFTYICWGRMISSSAGWRTLWRTTPDDHPLLIEQGSNRLGMYDNNGGGFLYSGYTATGLADAWVQYAVTGSSSGQTFYINGQQVGTTAYTTAGNRHNEWGSTGGGQPFGYVANMLLYSTILTPEQIQQNYYGQRRNFGLLSYTSVGSTTWIAPPDITRVDYLVVGGGGGGGTGYDNGAGGGGGAGMVLAGGYSVTPGQSYTITVGDGGAGGANARASNNGTTGSNSAFDTITGLGGGFGYGSRGSQATVGAAQVGSTTAATGGGGSGGGTGGNGGGGSTGAGTAHSGTAGGAGGSGTSSSITGSAVNYGVGAAGGASGSQNGGTAGTSNTGNGGQGGGAASTNSIGGGKGGSGIVVLSYY